MKKYPEKLKQNPWKLYESIISDWKTSFNKRTPSYSSLIFLVSTFQGDFSPSFSTIIFANFTISATRKFNRRFPFKSKCSKQQHQFSLLRFSANRPLRVAHFSSRLKRSNLTTKTIVRLIFLLLSANFLERLGYSLFYQNRNLN